MENVPAQAPPAPAGQELPIVVGTEEATLDQKGRIRLPRKVHIALGKSFYLWFTPWGCFAAFPQAVWMRVVGEANAGPVLNLEALERTRRLGEFAEETQCDDNGRFVIPYRLRQRAKWEGGDVVLVGCTNRLEIWRKQEYEAYEKDPEAYLRGCGMTGDTALDSQAGK